MKIGVSMAPESAAAHPGAFPFDFIEANVQTLLVPDQPEEVFQKNLRALERVPAPVTAANCFLPGRIKCVGAEALPDQVLAWAESTMRRAGQTEIRTIVFGSGSARSLPEGFPRERALEQVQEMLIKIGPMAEAANVILVIEPLNSRECNFINSLAEGADLIRCVGHPNVRLLADLFHMARDHQPPKDIETNGDYLVHVHVAEVAKRTCPGVDGDDFRPYLAALRKIGYTGAISIETLVPGTADELQTGWQTLRSQIADVFSMRNDGVPGQTGRF